MIIYDLPRQSFVEASTTDSRARNSRDLDSNITISLRTNALTHSTKWGEVRDNWGSDGQSTGIYVDNYCRFRLTSNVVKICVRARNRRVVFDCHANPTAIEVVDLKNLCRRFRAIDKPTSIPRSHAKIHGIRSELK